MLKERTHKLYSIVLSVILSVFLLLSGGLRPVLAEGTGSGTSKDDPYVLDGKTTETENPFPDKISDAEMQKVKQSAKNNLLMNNYIVKIEATLKDGSTILLGDMAEDGTVTYRMDLLQQTMGQITKIQIYMVLLSSSDDKTISYLGFASAFRYTGNSVEYYDDSKHDVSLNRSSLKINNQDVSTNIEYLQYTGIDLPQYITWTYDIPSNPIVYSRIYLQPVHQGNYGASFLLMDSYLVPSASFHYVDETAYRQALGLKKDAQIPQRSNGADISSMIPFTPVNVTDLKESLEFSDKYMINDLNPYFSLSADKPSTNRVFNESGSMLTTTTRPTYDQAMQDGPVGYVYVGDDIDKPADPSLPNSFKSSDPAGRGNYYFTPGVNADGTLAMHKHYYILERQMPSPIKIHKTDGENHPLEGVTFSLYRLNGDQETLIKEGLKTDVNGDLYSSAAESVSQDALTALTKDAYDSQAGYIESDHLAYLAPGNYRLKETTVPKGYKKNTFDLTVKSVQELVEDKAADVPVQTFSFANELLPQYPVEYSFVSAEEDQTLPDQVLQLLPSDSKTYPEGDTVSAIDPEQDEVKTDQGVWHFVGYDRDEITVGEDTLENGKVMFTGTWKFAPYMSTINQIPVITARDQTLMVGDSLDLKKDIKAYDVEDLDLTDEVQIIENNVPVNNQNVTLKAGSYTVTYKVTDSQGASSTKTITVTVKEKVSNNTTPSKEDGSSNSTQKTGQTEKKTSKTKTAATTYGLMYSVFSSLALMGLIGLVYYRLRKMKSL